MLAKARWGNRFCRYGCCRGAEFYSHGGRQSPTVRKRQRAKEKAQFVRELRNM